METTIERRVKKPDILICSEPQIIAYLKTQVGIPFKVHGNRGKQEHGAIESETLTDFLQNGLVLVRAKYSSGFTEAYAMMMFDFY